VFLKLLVQPALVAWIALGPLAPATTETGGTADFAGAVVVGRGGPNLVRGMGNLADTLDSLGLPYRFFGFDSAISEVVGYAKRVDGWMRAGGRAEIAGRLGLADAA